jgi:hypothetical protein
MCNHQIGYVNKIDKNTTIVASINNKGSRVETHHIIRVDLPTPNMWDFDQCLSK